jgi:ribosomal protein S18 acetylase RimI-like enzyme
VKERLGIDRGALRLRRGGAADADFVREVAVQVFAQFGDYGRILPTWLVHDGVLTHVAETLAAEPARPVGFTMLGFYPSLPGPTTSDEFVADLLAIAVAPPAQGKGVGRRLLEHAIAQVQAAARRLPIRELRLSVADTNLRARRLFQQFHFRLVHGDHGFYDGGQLALHLARPLDPEGGTKGATRR